MNKTYSKVIHCIDDNNTTDFKKVILEDKNELKYFLENNYVVSPLKMAVLNSDIKIVASILELIEQGCDFLIDNESLLLSIENGLIQISKTLIKSKYFDINYKNMYGNTVLMLALNCDSLELIDMILNDHKLKINLQNNFGRTALMLAIINFNIHIANKILKHPDIQINLTDRYSYNCLHYAVKIDCESLVRKILKFKDIDINLKNSFCKTPIQMSLENKDINNNTKVSVMLKHKYNITKMLLNDSRLDAKVYNFLGKSLLIDLIETNRNDLINMCLDKKTVDVNTTFNRKTPIMYAFENENYEIVNKLLDRFDTNMYINFTGYKMYIRCNDKNIKQKLYKYVDIEFEKRRYDNSLYKIYPI